MGDPFAADPTARYGDHSCQPTDIRQASSVLTAANLQLGQRQYETEGFGRNRIEFERQRSKLCEVLEGHTNV